MSEGFRDLYYHQPFQEDDHTLNTSLGQYSYTDTISSTFSSDHHHQVSELYPFFNSFSEFLLQSSHDHQNSFSSGVFGSSPPSITYEALKEDQKKAVLQGSELAEATPNSTISSDSADAVIGEDEHQDSHKGKKESGTTDHDIDEQVMKETLEEDSEETSKQAAKGKKKSEKKQKQPRFAFMTKSDVDHLEDGYRWRKYGQKAVKNSSYPRSYYRCTTKKCPVKKRVERSFQDPKIVITTYEGQHNHHIPTAFRGSVAAGIYPPLMLGHQPPSLDGFPSQMMPQLLHGNYGGVGMMTSNNHQDMNNVSSQQFSDYGLLQDILSPVFPKQEP